MHKYVRSSAAARASFSAAFILRAALALILAATAVAFTPPAAVARQAPTQPEAYALSLLNDARGDLGLRPLRWDGRLADVAQWRSDDMAQNNYFGHISWSRITDRLSAKKIKWYKLGETLVKGTPRSAMESAEEAIRVWQGSQPHWELLASEDFNYVAIGMARNSAGWYFWTALLLKGPDRTRPTASVTSADQRSGGRVTVNWTGADIQLSVLTSGLRDFQLQRRVGSKRWVRVTRWTAATSKTFDLATGKTYHFRVRARDNAGNVSKWSQRLTVAN